MVTVRAVVEGSPCHKAGVMPGDILVKIDSHPIGDVLDYRFYITESKLEMEFLRDGNAFTVNISKPRYDDVGLDFESYLMDEKKSCRNKCIFCFIDQNPCGMRETVYFKDDDTRLSFLMGNYVTLTNVSMNELERIVKMRLSPVNVSVHTTDGELRKMMLGNRFAGDILKKLRYLADGGIKLNCQLVLCRGINDGESLKKTLCELSGLYPAIESVAAVPAGLTGHREGLYELTPYDEDSAGETVDIIEAFQNEMKKKHGTGFVFASDEFYILAKRQLPDAESYEGYPQLDNGVGSLALMQEDVFWELDELDEDAAITQSATLFTGEAAFEYINKMTEAVKSRVKCCAEVKVLCAENRFFGGRVTVAGLLTGSDIISAAEGAELGSRVILPAQMLRSEGDLFLDDMTPQELEEKLSRPIVFVEDGAQLVRVLTGGKDE